jgi:hypothetical protein
MDDPHPVLLNITDNMSTLNWTIHRCKHSKLSCLLAHFFCSMLINSPLDINSRWISTKENIIADDISRIKKESTSNQLPAFDYSTLKQRYPELKHCFFFQIQPELISLIWDIVLTKKWPTHKEVEILKQRLFGKLISENEWRYLEYLTHVVHFKGTKESWPFTSSTSNAV